MTTVQLARKLFEAYNATPPNAGLTWDGRPVPKWEECGDQVRGKWVGAALEAMKVLGGGKTVIAP